MNFFYEKNNLLVPINYKDYLNEINLIFKKIFLLKNFIPEIAFHPKSDKKYRSDFRFVKKYFNISQDGNFEDEATRQKTGDNILYLSTFLTQDEQMKWEPIKAKLNKHRSTRVKPGCDDKILTDSIMLHTKIHHNILDWQNED